METKHSITNFGGPFIPQIGELLFMGANAKVDLKPIMNLEDLQKGLAAAFGN